MSWLSLIALSLYAAICIGIRSWIHVRETGASPFLNGPEGNGMLAVVSFFSIFAAAAILDLTRIVPLLVESTRLAIGGTIVATLGIGMTMWGQFDMGNSWRVGIDSEERIELVTTGLYAHVRNPIYSGGLLFAFGLVLLVPNAVSLSGLIVVLVVLEIVVRRIEEPYLESVHGLAFRSWASTTSCFLPRLGRLGATSQNP